MRLLLFVLALFMFAGCSKKTYITNPVVHDTLYVNPPCK